MHYLFKGYSFFCSYDDASHPWAGRVVIHWSRIAGRTTEVTEIPPSVFAVLAAQIGLVGPKCRYQGATRPVHLAIDTSGERPRLVLHTYGVESPEAGESPVDLWSWEQSHDSSPTSQLVDDIISILSNPLMQTPYLSHIPSDAATNLTMGGPYEGGGDNHNLALEVCFTEDFSQVDLISDGNPVTVSSSWLSQSLVNLFGVPWTGDAFEYPKHSVPHSFFKYTWGAGMSVTRWTKYLGESDWSAVQTITSPALCQILVTTMDWVARARAALPIQIDEAEIGRLLAGQLAAVYSQIKGIHSHLTVLEQELVRDSVNTMALVLACGKKLYSPKFVQQLYDVLIEHSSEATDEMITNTLRSYNKVTKLITDLPQEENSNE